MKIYFSLLLLLVAGVAIIALPESFLGIPKSNLTGILRLWENTLKIFAIPLCLLILSFTKNFFIQIACAIWGLWLLVTSLLLAISVLDYAPQINLYGKVFLAGVLVASLALFLFSSIQFVPKDPKLPPVDDMPVNPS